MIVGHGDIASVLKDREGFCFFASGVSNSGETRESEYIREIELLASQDTSLHLVYFSSLAVLYGDTPYVHHKRAMEDTIKRSFPSYTIVRIGNISFGNNPHTIINFLRAKINAGGKFDIQDVYRYVVDEAEFLYWIGLIPEWSCELNIPGRRLKVKEIVREIIEGKL